MTTMLALDRLALGPADGGRGFDVLAATLGLSLPAEARSAIKDFNLRIGDYMAAGIEIHACFPVSVPPARRLWFVSTTNVHKREAGNLVWITWGVILDETQMTAIDGRADRLIGMLHRRRRPQLGEELTPLEVSVEALAAAPEAGPRPGAIEFLRHSAHVGQTPQLMRAHTGADPVACLGAMLGVANFANRQQASWVTAPVPLHDWHLACFKAADWAGAEYWTVPVEQQLDVYATRIEGGAPASANATALHLLCTALEASRDPHDKKLTPGLAGLGGGDDIPLGTRIEAFMQHEASQGGGAIETMMRLFRGTARIEEKDARELIMQALRSALESVIGTAAEPAAWFEAFYTLDDAVRAAIGAPMSMPRIAAEQGIIFRLSLDLVDKIGEATLKLFRNQLTLQSAQSPLGPPASEARLLAQCLPRLTAGSDDSEQWWTLAKQLARRSLASAAEADPQGSEDVAKSKKVLVELLQIIVTMRRSDGVAAMFNRRNRKWLRTLYGDVEYAGMTGWVRNESVSALTSANWPFAFVVESLVVPGDSA